MKCSDGTKKIENVWSTNTMDNAHNSTCSDPFIEFLALFPTLLNQSFIFFQIYSSW